jgi:hypothetical protein
MKIESALAKTKIPVLMQPNLTQETYEPTTVNIPGAAGGPRRNVKLAPAKLSAY